MSFDFKIPDSFLKRKGDQEQTENVDVRSTGSPTPSARRQELPSGRLFGNLTRGGPTSVQNPNRIEGSRLTVQKPRRLTEWVHSDAARDSASRSITSSIGPGDSVSRFRLVRNVEKNKQLRGVGSTAADERWRPAAVSSLRKRSSSSIASAAAVKRASKVARTKRSSSREDAPEAVIHPVNFNFNAIPSTNTAAESVCQTYSPPKFRAASYAAESKSTTREEAVLLRSLLALVGKHCPTELDRYQVLEERDKLLSKLRDEENKHDDGKCRSVMGQCLGMCPEKERYIRVVQKRVSPFECGHNGQMEPDYMVKEYARSAADQENPLPHELRSKDLLQNTMAYLLKHVLDSAPTSEDDLAIWYDFLWSRTRALRKEITQLMLSDSTAVALIERCARLHILCAYKLCQLGFDRFDQNMNTENLAKCLQSLRHLYEDLGMQGQFFSTEAEFRGYDVMLHLYDTNVMRQVLSYRKEVRESQPVRLALQLSSALQNKNYVRFFRLLKKEATFLQSCLCHRFFNTVQSKALLTMMTAYGRHSSFLLEMEYLLRVLAWDDRDDALASLALYKIHTSDMDNDLVVFDRDAFVQDPAMPPKLYRWIDAKSNAAWSQVVHGPETFSFRSLAVVPDSFDNSGIYNKDPVMAAVIEKYGLQSEAQQILLAQQPSGRPVAPSSKDQQSEALCWVKSIVENVAREVADQQSLAICYSVRLGEIISSMVDSLIDHLTRELLFDTLLEERKLVSDERAYLDSQRKREANLKFTQQIVDQILNQLVSEQLLAILKQEIREQVCQYIDITARFLVDELWRTKLWYVVDKETKSVLRKTLKSDIEEISVGLRRFREQMELLWLRQFWDAWRSRVLENRRKREERLHDWETFQGVWNCQVFLPSNYASVGEIKRRDSGESVACTFISSGQMHVSLKMMQFKKARTKRIMRSFFNKWRSKVERRRYLRSITKRMLHRPMPFSSIQSLCSEPPHLYGAKRKRTRSPILPSLYCSFSKAVSPFDERSLSDSNLFGSFTEFSTHESVFSCSRVDPCGSFSEAGYGNPPSFSVGMPFLPPSPPAIGCDTKECVSSTSRNARPHREWETFIEQGETVRSALERVEETQVENDSMEHADSQKEDLCTEAASLHEKMLQFSKDLSLLIKQRKEVDEECRHTVLELSASPRMLSGSVQ